MGIRHIEYLFPYTLEEPLLQAPTPDENSNGLITEVITEPI